jgi:hypothetical protein
MRNTRWSAISHAILLGLCTLFLPFAGEDAQPTGFKAKSDEPAAVKLATPTPPPSDAKSQHPLDFMTGCLARLMSYFQGPVKIGQVIVVGNEKVPDQIIRKAINLYPGQILKYPDLRRAEANLAALNLFVIDSKLGIRPTITVLDDPSNPGLFKDVLVQVMDTMPPNLPAPPVCQGCTMPATSPAPLGCQHGCPAEQ